MIKILNTFLKISVLSIITIYPIFVYSSEFKGLNKLFKVFDNKDIENESIIKTDEIRLLGISKLKIPLILLEINGSVFELKIGQKKFGYEFFKIRNTTVIIKKNNVEYEFNIGDKPIIINVKNSVFSSNLLTQNISKNFITNSEAINLELKKFKNALEKDLSKISFSKFEQKIIDEIKNYPDRSNTGRIGLRMPPKIIGQPIEQFGLKEDDVILTINGIPIKQVSDIYKLYKNESVNTYYIEIKRSEKLIMVEWYK